jgi:hypothetical protein
MVVNSLTQFLARSMPEGLWIGDGCSIAKRGGRNAMFRLISAIGCGILCVLVVLMVIQVFLGKTRDALDAAKAPAAFVEVEGQPKCTLDDGELVATGKLRNRGLGPVENLSVSVIWRNALGQSVLTDRIDLLEKERQLMPSASVSFRSTKESIAGAESCEVSVSVGN